MIENEMFVKGFFFVKILVGLILVVVFFFVVCIVGDKLL